MHSVLNPTQSVLDIANRLEEAGFEAWCVGGALRDALLGGAPLDWDLATSARPEQVQALFGKKRTIPVGIEFGTVCVLDPDGIPHEITTFRRDVKTDGRHAEVEFGASLDDDLARRDFTINAIAFRPRSGEVRDPFDGQGDIERKVVRAVGDAEQRMKEDRLRALRAIRFAARYDFEIAKETHTAIRSSAPFLTRLSAERVQQEIVKTMQQVESPSRAMRLWRDTGALAVLIPALGELSDVALATLDHLAREGAGGRKLPQRTTNRVAALFLDGSPALAREAMTALRFSKHDINWTVAIVSAWHAVGEEIAASIGAKGEVGDVAMRRWLARIGRLHAAAFLRVAGARWQAMCDAGHSAPSSNAVRALHRGFVRHRFDAIEIGDLAIGGDDLRAAGIPPGPLYAKILAALLDRVIEEPARNTPEALLGELPKLMAGFNGGAGASSQH